MTIRVIRVRKRRHGAEIRREDVVPGSRASIGRGTSNDIELEDLSVGLEHGEIYQSEGEWFVRALGPEPIRINGRLPRSGRIGFGDEIAIGIFRLKLRPGESEEDLGIEVTRAAGVAPAAWVTPADEIAGLGRRPLAWMVAVGVLLLSGILPFIGEGSRWWSSGAVANAHADIADSCERCHGESFAAVTNEQCVSCHAVGGHVPKEVSSEHAAQIQCISCHAEHNGAQGLDWVADATCTESECHATLGDKLGKSRGIANVSDFGDGHPEFRIQLVEDWAADPTRVRWHEDPRSQRRKERSGLKFNHYRHVGKGVQPTKNAPKEVPRGHLRCDGCHRPQADGKRMEPIDFETHCADCHRPFVEAGEAVLHGNVEAMRVEIEQYFARTAFEDSQGPMPLKRPGRPGWPSAAARRADRKAWVDQRVETVIVYLLGDPEETCDVDDPEVAYPVLGEHPPRTRCGQCALCHYVTTDPRGVPEPKILEVWMPGAQFSHRAHRTMTCADCHAAAAVRGPQPYSQDGWPGWAEKGTHELIDRGEDFASKTSEDVLIPGYGLCADCHGGDEASPPRIASDCVLCHSFHQSAEDQSYHPLVREDQGGAAPTAGSDSLKPFGSNWFSSATSGNSSFSTRMRQTMDPLPIAQ